MTVFSGRRMVSVMAAAAALAAPAVVRAEPPVEWQAPAACPDAPWFVERVRAHLGETPLPDDFTMALTIEATGQRFTLTLRTRDGERQLESPRCAEVVEAAALVVALAIGPLDEPPEPEPRPVRTAWLDDGETPPPGQIGFEAGARAERPRRLHVALRAMAGADVGFLPTAGLGGGVAVAGELGSWRLEVAGYWAQGGTAEGMNRDLTIDVSAYFVEVGACWRLGWGLEWLSLCGAGDLGDMRADWSASPAAPTPGTTTQRIRAGAGGPSIDLALGGRFLVRLDARVIVSDRPRFEDEINPGDILFQPDWIAARLAAGVEVRFP